MALKNTKRNKELAGILLEAEYDFKMHVPDNIMILLHAFLKNNKKLYIVGGAVRDALLKREPKDFDVVTDALPDEVKQILDSEKISNFPSGKNFGILTAVINNDSYEIATFRADKYSENSDGRRPDEVVYGDIIDDSERRDLTINALYYDIQNQKVIDLVGGVEDLKNKKIKPVGDAISRFTEDRLRTLRALRFAHRFGSTLDKETIDAIIHFKHLPGVSNERIRDEFYKALESTPKPEEFVEQFLSLGLGPRTFGNNINIDLRHVKELREPVLVLAKLLWNNNPQNIKQSLLGFKCTSDEIKSILFLKMLLDKFKEFDKVVFDPFTDGKWLEQMIVTRDILFQKKILNSQIIKTWAELMSLNNQIISFFVDFIPPFSAKDFPDMKPGKELGAKITIENAKAFLNKL